MKSRSIRSLIVLAAGAGAAAAGATPPPFSVTSIAKSGNSVLGTSSTISNSIDTQFFASRAFQHVCVNSSGAWQLHVDTRHNSNLGNTVHEAILRTQTVQGPFTPYILQGATGFLSAPTVDTTAYAFFASDLNNVGNGIFAIGWGPDDFAGQTSTGVFYNNNRVVFLQGDAVLAVGLAPGTVWNAVDASTAVSLNDNNRVLVSSMVTESGTPKRVLVAIQLDPSGTPTGTTLIAKEGGPVGAGPATWASIAGGQHSAAMNNAGTVAFTGTTSAGTSGVYSTAGAGAFVATSGGPTPVSGVSWGQLAGSSVDINASGTVVFRGLAANATGTYTESADAGDVPDAEDHTYGNGALNRIVGTLSNDQDVDMFRITVTDANAFTATTVPDPGSGFAGAAFDTVLSLIAEPGNGTRGIAQCDNVSPGVLQSTITGAGGVAITGRSYYLAISTPKSKAGNRVWNYATNWFPLWDIWQGDPGGVAVSGGLVYWPDTSENAIRRATTAGAIQSDLPAPSVTGSIAIDSTGGKLYWADRSSSEKIRRSNLDGSLVEDIVTVQGFGTLTAYGCTGLAVDAARGKVYWTRSVFGEINRCDLDGQNAQYVIRDYPPTGDATPAVDPTGTFAPGSIAIDTSAGTNGKIYWVNGYLNRIERCNINGTGRAPLAGNIGAGATSICIDSAAGKLYWTNTAGNAVMRANLDGTSVETVASTSAPTAISIDPSATSNVYWTNIVDRVVRRAPTTGLPSAASDVVLVGIDSGQRAADGPGTGYSSGFGGWTRYGTAGSTPLPYQIKLSGATFQYPQTMIAKGNQKVAAVGDAVPGVANSVVNSTGDPSSAIKINERGDVLWIGAYYPVYANNVPPSALFLNLDPLLVSNQIPAGTSPTLNAQKLVFFPSGAGMLDMSSNGRYAMVQANMLAPPYSFTQFDNALLFEFTLPPSCPADFNGTGGLTVQDIFDFLGAWFSGDPRADFNGVGGISVQDIFDFLGAWFAGC